VSGARRVLRDRGVVAWAVAAGVSQAGDAVWFVALAWTAVRLDGPGLAGVVMASSALPRAALMLAGGALTDRFDAWRLMLGADVARVLVLAAAFLWLQVTAPSAALLIAVGVCLRTRSSSRSPRCGSSRDAARCSSALRWAVRSSRRAGSRPRCSSTPSRSR
jgi:MFS family permease